MDEPKPKHVSEHLANERTVLAWLRTSIAVMTFGIAINRFSLFLVELHLPSQGQRIANRNVEHLGIGLIALGMAIMICASIQYLSVARMIERETYRPRRFMVLAVAASVVLFGGVALVLLFSA